MLEGLFGLAKGVGKAGLGLAGVTGKGAINFASGIADGVARSPMAFAATVGVGASIGAAASKADGRSDVGKSAANGALTAAAVSGVAGVTGIGGAIATGVTASAFGVGKGMMNLGTSMISKPTTALNFNNIDSLKLNKFGTTAMLGTAFVGSVLQAANKFEQSRMGTHDGMVRKPTPVLPQNNQQPSYANNGGATGDLVFSMYNNR